MSADQHRGRRKLRKGGRKRRAQEDAAEIWYGSSKRPRSLYIPFYRFPREERRAKERRRERRRDTVNPGDNPGVWPYYISRLGGGLLLDDIILTAAPPVHASLAHFSRRASTKRARERRLSCTRDNGFPGSRGSSHWPVHPTGQSRSRVNEFSPWMKPRRPLRPIARLPRRSESAFLAFFSSDFSATSALTCTDHKREIQNWSRAGELRNVRQVSSQHEQFMRFNVKRMLIVQVWFMWSKWNKKCFKQ